MEHKTLTRTILNLIDKIFILVFCVVMALWGSILVLFSFIGQEVPPHVINFLVGLLLIVGAGCVAHITAKKNE
jgi:hypothetical protein